MVVCMSVWGNIIGFIDLLHGSYAWTFCMGRCLRACGQPFPAQKKNRVVVGCFSTVILGLSMVDQKARFKGIYFF